MIVLPSSVSVAGTSAASGAAGAPASTGASTATGSGGGGAGAGLGGDGGASIDARIREIGGNTVVFLLGSPSSERLAAGCLSISDTLATFRRGAGAAGASAAPGFDGVGGLEGAAAAGRETGLTSGF